LEFRRVLFRSRDCIAKLGNMGFYSPSPGKDTGGRHHPDPIITARGGEQSRFETKLKESRPDLVMDLDSVRRNSYTGRDYLDYLGRCIMDSPRPEGLDAATRLDL